MELDDLRRQWQQPALPSSPLNQVDLGRLLAQHPAGLVEKMRRNARLETAFVALMAVAMPFIIRLANNFLERALVVSLFLLALVLLWYYYRKLLLLHQLTQPDGHVLGNLRRLCTGLRGLLRFNYSLTLTLVPASLLLVYEYLIVNEMTRPGGFRLMVLLGACAALLAMGAGLYWAAAQMMRWSLQHLYGQHLDRLEASWRELEASAA